MRGSLLFVAKMLNKNFNPKHSRLCILNPVDGLIPAKLAFFTAKYFATLYPVFSVHWFPEILNFISLFLSR